VPDNFARSYSPLDFGKYGVGVWFYEVKERPGIFYAGEVEWVNFPRYITRPKHPNADHFAFRPSPGVKFKMQGVMDIPGLSPVQVAGQLYSIAKAKIPLKLPLPLP